MTWFDGQGAFSAEELKLFIEDYKKFGRPHWDTKIDLGKSVEPQIEIIVNELTNRMGRLSDRLALTIIGLAGRKPIQHAGDCTIYARLHNDTPESGICTCGYGLHVMRMNGGNMKEMYSSELLEKLSCVGGGI